MYEKYFADVKTGDVTGIVEKACVIFHKHRASYPYHRHGRAGSLRQAIRSIKGHDVFQLNGRKHSQ